MSDATPPADRLHAELTGGAQQRLQLALSAGRFGLWEWDIESGAVTWSDEIYRFYKLSPTSFKPDLDGFVDLIHPEDRIDVQRALEGALEDGLPYHVIFRGLTSDDEIIWLEGWGQVVRDDHDTPVGMIGLVQDASNRINADADRARLLKKEREARAAAEASRQRMTFLTHAFRVLGTSLDLDATIDRLLRLIVPHLGDWAVVYLVREGQIECVGSHHRDPDKELILESLVTSVDVSYDTPGGVGEVLRTGTPVLQGQFDDSLLDEVGLDDDQRRQVELVGVESYIIVPLKDSGRTIGTVSFGASVAARPYTSDDLELAERLADRAGAAIANALLFSQRTRIAKVLQRSLLPAGFPDLPGCELAGSYRSAGEGLDVGGDFYDVFQIDQDRYALAIGDVSGKGHEAAAITALTRHTLRATALLRSKPSSVLEAVNDVLLDQKADSRFCTVVYGVARPHESGLTIRLASGGHHPPMVARRNGEVDVVASEGVLLGMFDQIRFEDVSIELGPGDVLLLYTDGLTDVVIDGELLGDGWLRSELASVRDKSVNEIIRTIDERIRVTGGVLVDDVAMLGLKVADRP